MTRWGLPGACGFALPTEESHDATGLQSLQMELASFMAALTRTRASYLWPRTSWSGFSSMLQFHEWSADCCWSLCTDGSWWSRNELSQRILQGSRRSSRSERTRTVHVWASAFHCSWDLKLPIFPCLAAWGNQETVVETTEGSGGGCSFTAAAHGVF